MIARFTQVAVQLLGEELVTILPLLATVAVLPRGHVGPLGDGSRVGGDRAEANPFLLRPRPCTVIASEARLPR